jgi:hypothetical protein
MSDELRQLNGFAVVGVSSALDPSISARHQDDTRTGLLPQCPTELEPVHSGSMRSSKMRSGLKLSADEGLPVRGDDYLPTLRAQVEPSVASNVGSSSTIKTRVIGRNLAPADEDIGVDVELFNGC